MRALLGDPGELTAGDYARFVRRCALLAMMPDYLAHGQPYLALNAVVLTPREHHRLQHLSEAFVSAFFRAGCALAQDVARLEEMGFPWVAAELLAAEQPRLPVTGRFDFVEDRAGRWWLLEFNADTPSGIREALGAEAQVRRLLTQAAGLECPNDHLAPRLRAAFTQCAGPFDGRSGALGLVTVASELEDLMQMAFLQRLLDGLPEWGGRPVILGDIDNLRPAGSGVSLSGRPISALYRYVPFETMFGSPPFAAICNAVAAERLLLINGLFGLLLQHKGLMAWVWEHRDDRLFSNAERAAIKSHLVPTWYIEDPRSPSERAGLVAKQVFGREGEEVFFGGDLTAKQWDALRRRGTYVAQTRIDVAPFPAAVVTDREHGVRTGAVTVGAYTAGPRFAGYYSRFGGRIINSRALWFATLTDPSGEQA